MRFLHILITAILLITTPTTLLFPHSIYEEIQAPGDYAPTYDDIIQLLDDIESGAAEQKYSQEEIARFLAHLAKIGAMPEESAALEEDISELLTDSMPIAATGYGDIILCKGWLKKQWGHVKHFAKKHKTVLIVAAVVVVAVAVIGVTVAAGAGAVGAAAAADSGHHKSSTPAEVRQEIQETLAQTQFLEPGEVPIEESARIFGSLFTHDHLQHVPDLGHPEADRKFATDYSYLYPHTDFNTLVHQVRGERALEFGQYNQAITDFSKAIEFSPTNPIPYLERGVAHFGAGDYDRSLEDYKQFVAQSPQPSASDFTIGFARGLPKGLYESGHGMLVFLTEFATHPVRTSTQIADSISTLASLVHSDEWGVIAEALSPEVHKLVTEWERLPSDEKGELAGYALGKHGADILLPGAIVKVAGKSVKAAQELTAVCKNIQTAKQTLLLETAAEIGSGAKVAKIIENGENLACQAEELGFSAQEFMQLQKTGKLEDAVADKFSGLPPHLQASHEWHQWAQAKLKPHIKKAMPEEQVRELIEKTAIQTFPRPKGIPEDYIVRITEKGAGMEYVHPTNTQFSVRVMPGKAHSPWPHQQKPYVIQMKNGKAFDKHGNMVSKAEPEAHIPLEEFIFRD